MDNYVEKGKFNSKKWIANNTTPINEHTVTFTSDEMKMLHNTGELVKTDPEGKEHTYMYSESKGVNEAGMDKGFEKEFESSCTAFINHIKAEIKTAKGTDKSTLQKMLKNLLTVKGYPKLMANIVGYE